MLHVISIKAKFKKSEKTEPYLGAYIHLARAVSGQKFSRKSISKNFKKLMPSDEYDKAETKELINYLVELTDESQNVRGVLKTDQNRPLRSSFTPQ